MMVTYNIKCLHFVLYRHCTGADKCDCRSRYHPDDSRHQQGDDPRVRFPRRSAVLHLPGVRHAADDGRQAQVQHLPRGVHLRSPQPVPGHHQHLPVHPDHHRC